MPRHYYALDLKDDAAAIAEYERWHRPGVIWPEIVARSRGSAPAFYQVNTVKDRPTIEELKSSRRARRRRLDL